jgi:hypothetical protein
MKKTIAAAMFLAVGAGTLGASALDIKGSDTLRRFTQSLVNANPEAGEVGNHCTNAFASLDYIGGGSGAGETAIATRLSAVTMMSRALGTGLCGFSDAATEPQLDTAEGIAFAKDGISLVFANSADAGGGALTRQDACDPDGACPGTSPYPAGGTGLGPNDIGGNNLADGTWRATLRYIYWGLSPTDAAVAANRSCTDPARVALLDNYGTIFDNACTPGGVDGDGNPCTKLRRAFRRDEASGTTEVFRAALGAGSVPFCNVYIPTTDAAPACIAGLNPSASSAYYAPPYTENFQDNDPIRRSSLGNGFSANLFIPNSPTNRLPTEQVASNRGDLGVVLPVSIPPNIADQADLYPTQYCTNGVTRAVQAPAIPTFPVSYGLCPDGTVPANCNWNATLNTCSGSPGVCRKPATSTGDVRCINPGDIRPPRPAGKEVPGGACTPPGGIADGRVYNLHSYQNTATDPKPYLTHQYPVAGVLAGRSMVGSFFRIHTTRVASTGVSRRACTVAADCSSFVASATCNAGFCSVDCDSNADCTTTFGANKVCTAAGRCVAEATCGAGFAEGACCTRTSDTDQIGCLAAVSQCSTGFAGTSAKDVTQAVAGVTKSVFGASLNAVTPETACIADGTYGLHRDLFINTAVGFENLEGARFGGTAAERTAQLELARCVSGTGAIAGTTLNDLFTRYDLIAKPTGPACQEFNDTSCSGEPAAGSAACSCNRTGTKYYDVACSVNGDCAATSATATCVLGQCIDANVATTTPAGIPCNP